MASFPTCFSCSCISCKFCFHPACPSYNFHGVLPTSCSFLGAITSTFTLQHLSLYLPFCCFSLFSCSLPLLSPTLPLSGYTISFLVIFCPLLMLFPCPSMLQGWHPAGTDAVSITSWPNSPCFHLIPVPFACFYPAKVSICSGGL